jgi:hypothetical protein
MRVRPDWKKSSGDIFKVDVKRAKEEMKRMHLEEGKSD